MSTQNEAIQNLEYIKYYTVKRQVQPDKTIHVGFKGKGDYSRYLSEDTDLNLPEGITINFKSIQINWGAYFFNPDENAVAGDKAFWFEFSNGTVGQMKENFYKDLIINGVSYRRYIFTSNYYKDQEQKNPNQVMNWINTYDNINYINQYGESFFPMSMVMVIKNTTQNIGNFEEFMSMSYTNWRVSFDYKYQRFLNYFEGDLFDAYPPQVIVDYLSKDDAIGNADSSRLIAIFNKLCDGWYNGTGLSASIRTSVLLNLLSHVKPENAKEIYDKFFESPSAMFYHSVVEKLDDDGAVFKFTSLLIKLFYAQMTRQDLQVYTNKVENLPKGKILPFLFEEYKFIKKGPAYEFEHNSDGLKIKKMAFWVYKPMSANDSVNINRIADPNNPNENTFSYIDNLQFDYNDIIGALACFDRPDQGFNQLMVYPIPAFAFPVFHNQFSKKYTLNDFLGDINTVACIIFPFFRIVQLEAISYNLVSLIFGATGAILTGPVKDKIKETPAGKHFIYLYDILSNGWVAQDLSRAILSGGYKAMMDCENLLAAWSLYNTADGYGAFASAYPIEAKEIKDNIEIIKISHEKLKKNWNK